MSIENELKNCVLKLYNNTADIVRNIQHEKARPNVYDALENIEYIKASILKLISFQRSLAIACEYPRSGTDFQVHLQKAEESIRKHIKNRCEMRVHAEKLQQKLEQVQTKQKSRKKELKEEIKRLEAENTELMKQANPRTQLTQGKIELSHSLLELQTLRKERLKLTQTLKNQESFYKRKFQQTNNECQKIKSEINRITKNSYLLKQKLLKQ